MKIIPGILRQTKDRIENDLSVCENNFREIQIDLCNVNFVKNKTFSSNLDLKNLTILKKMTKKFLIELDLMVDFKKQKFLLNSIDNINEVKFHKVIFHLSAVKNFDLIFENLNPKIKVGLGIQLIDLEIDIQYLLENYNFDYVQIMGIVKLGFQKQKLNEKKLLNKIEFIKENFPKMKIQVDGGCNLKTYEFLEILEIDTCIMGSAIFFGKREENIEKIKLLNSN
jgi:pentose-5-phosphate-3-epimerase